MKNKKNNPKKTATINNKFSEAVEGTPHIARSYKKGLQALGSNSSKIILDSTISCEGSVDIDQSLIQQYPNDNRWDYCLSYKGEVYFVEVHPAHTGEINTVLNKLKWLKKWLREHAPAINNLKANSTNSPFVWIQTNGCHFLPTGKQLRQLSEEGLIPKSVLRLR